MGRPSRLEAIAEKRDGKVVRIKVGGATVIGAEGTIEVPVGY
jgi:predicted PhzF superfamily epimerase YddE/YHI9